MAGTVTPRVLLVEDSEERVAWFRQRFPEHLDVTASVDEAIQRLQERQYDLLFLDHDLGTEPRVGRDVAQWLIAHPENNPNLFTIVHSVNHVSGPKIVQDLRDQAKRPVWWVPFLVLRLL